MRPEERTFDAALNAMQMVDHDRRCCEQIGWLAAAAWT